MVFSEGIERALRAALAAHAGQKRKGDPELPYVSHPVHVALILARLGLGESVIQAALLHDVVEDCDDWDELRVRETFGGEVADIVSALTEDKSLGWDERKRRAIEDVARMSAEAAHVKAADKLHNLSSLVGELERASDPDTVWREFRGGRERTLRTAAQLVRALQSRVHPELATALGEVVGALEELADRD